MRTTELIHALSTSRGKMGISSRNYNELHIPEGLRLIMHEPVYLEQLTQSKAPWD
jgi:hypothetical protein